MIDVQDGFEMSICIRHVQICAQSRKRYCLVIIEIRIVGSGGGGIVCVEGSKKKRSWCVGVDVECNV